MIHIAICDDEKVFVEKIRDEVKAVLETQDEDFEIFCYTDGNKLLADYEAKNLHGFGINSMKKFVMSATECLNFMRISIHLLYILCFLKNNIFTIYADSVDKNRK